MLSLLTFVDMLLIIISSGILSVRSTLWLFVVDAVLFLKIFLEKQDYHVTLNLIIYDISRRLRWSIFSYVLFEVTVIGSK